MPEDLERLLAELGRAPTDRTLDGAAGDVASRLAEISAENSQTWRLRAAAVALVAVSGAVAGGYSAASATPNRSPFAAWSSLAPSSLLEPAE